MLISFTIRPVEKSKVHRKNGFRPGFVFFLKKCYARVDRSGCPPNRGWFEQQFFIDWNWEKIMKQFLAVVAFSTCILGVTSTASAQYWWWTIYSDHSKTITEIVATSGGQGEFDRNYYDYDLLLNAVLAANLQDALADPDADLTLFAPNDLAFIRLARDLGYQGWKEEEAFNFIVEALTELGDGDPIPVLTNVLLYHVVPESLRFWEVLFSREIETLLDGATIRPRKRYLRLRDNDPDFRDPRLSWPANVCASNGIIHTINRVLIPVDLPNGEAEPE